MTVWNQHIDQRMIYAYLFGVIACASSAMACLPLPAEPATDAPKEPSSEVIKKDLEQSQDVSTREPCAKAKSAADRHACFEREFDAADRILNQLYKKLRSQLSEPIRSDLQENSRGWIQMKEYNCEFQAEILNEVSDETRQAEFYRCALSYTTDRTKYLRKAFGRKGVHGGVAGEYDDGYAGNLKFEKGTQKDTYKFQIDVVRGPTAHLGEIASEVHIPNGEIGVYEERPDCSGVKNAVMRAGPREPCCRLDFRLRENKGYRTIEVKETDCSYYHGARAYFDGLYRKVK